MVFHHLTAPQEYAFNAGCQPCALKRRIIHVLHLVPGCHHIIHARPEHYNVSITARGDGALDRVHSIEFGRIL